MNNIRKCDIQGYNDYAELVITETFKELKSLLLQKPSKNSKAKNLKSSCVGKKNETLAKK